MARIEVKTPPDRRVAAIKALREATADRGFDGNMHSTWGLKEAKEAIEAEQFDIDDKYMPEVDRLLRSQAGCTVRVVSGPSDSTMFGQRRAAVYDMGDALIRLGNAFKTYASAMEPDKDEAGKEIDPIAAFAAKLEL